MRYKADTNSVTFNDLKVSWSDFFTNNCCAEEAKIKVRRLKINIDLENLPKLGWFNKLWKANLFVYRL